jgi:hypothetical protein
MDVEPQVHTTFRFVGKQRSKAAEIGEERDGKHGESIEFSEQISGLFLVLKNLIFLILIK